MLFTYNRNAVCCFQFVGGGGGRDWFVPSSVHHTSTVNGESLVPFGRRSRSGIPNDFPLYVSVLKFGSHKIAIKLVGLIDSGGFCCNCAIALY